ncbi:MAG: flavin reductase [Burkholderiales bacterium]|nr:MAG: flavin reductase [Burkholderiales bacterium]
MPPLPHIDHRTLRQAFGCFPTGVTIVTTLGADGAFAGVTINSFTSLSLDPPLILWTLSKRSSTLRAFESAGHFAVNILADDQVALSRRFSSPAPDRFHDVAVRAGLSGPPLIEGCSAHIECRAHSSQAAGDHVLFVGRVERVQTSGKPPLVFVGGRYRSAGAERG